jgi:DNA-binding transcriptional LysR family regulator
MGFSSCPFLPNLLRKYKASHPGVALRLVEDVPQGQDAAFDRGEIDIGFTRPPSADRSSSYQSRLIFREPLVAALPKERKVATRRVRISDLAGERFVTFQRTSSPEVFDTIVRVCNDNGFSPHLHHELNNMNSVLATVEAGEGVAIVPATARNMRADSISFFRLQPDEVRIDFVAAWQKKEPSVALRSFLELLDGELPAIRKQMKFA